MAFHTRVVGVSYPNPDGSDRQLYISELSVGVSLTLRREPSNPHDSNAIAVLDPRGRQLGYIKRELAQELSREMDSGVKYVATVSAITGGDIGMNYGVNIYIEASSEGSFRIT